MEHEILSKIPDEWRGEPRELSPPGVVLGAVGAVFAAAGVLMLAYIAGLLLLLAAAFGAVAGALAYLGLVGRPRLLVISGATALVAALVLAVRGLPFRFGLLDATALLLVLGGLAAMLAGVEPWRAPSKPSEPSEETRVEPPKSAA